MASVVVAIGALTLARIGVAGPPEAFTQLWLQDTAAGESPVVGVESRESAEMAYRLDLVIDGRTVSSSEFRLAPGQQRLVAAPGLTPGSTFEALLFLQASPDAVYRRVLLHVPTATAQPSGQDGEAASTPPS